MAIKVIPISSGRSPAPAFEGGTLRDSLGRSMHDLRISVTDRCNFRCVYCMPREVFDAHYNFLPHSAILSFEEIARLARIFVGLGVEKIRLTGGEPLVRRDLYRLVAMLKELDVELTLTTNGSLLARNAQALARAGLDRVKVNMVVKRGVNDRDILPMAERWRGSGHIARFIEYMDVGSSNGWRMDDVVPSAEVVRRISERWPLEPVDANCAGEIAVISSVTQAFCHSCTRMRLSTEGALFTCLFAQSGHDLKSLVRGGASDEEIRGEIAAVWQRRADRYSEIRTEATSKTQKVEMS